MTGYVVTPYVGSAPAPGYSPITVVGATAQSANIPGLNNLQTYTIHVAATNGSGTGPDAISNPVTPNGYSSDGLGLEQFYPYQKAAIGTGTQYTNLFNGNSVVQSTDLSLPATGLNMVVKRTYNSQRRDKSDVVGPGWQLSVSDGQDALQGSSRGSAR